MITGIRWEGRLFSATRTDRSIQPLHEIITSITAGRITTTRAPIRVITAVLITTATEIGIPVEESASILDRAIPDSAATAPITAAGSGSEEVLDTVVFSDTIITALTTDTTDTTEVIINTWRAGDVSPLIPESVTTLFVWRVR